MIKYIFYEKHISFLFYVNKKLKFLTQNVLTRTKFLYSLIKNVKYFN